MSKSESDQAREADIEIIVNAYNRELPIIAAGATAQYDRSGLLRIIADMARRLEPTGTGTAVKLPTTGNARHLRLVKSDDPT